MYFFQTDLIYLFLKFHCHQFSSRVPSNQPVKPWPPMNPHIITRLTISPSKTSEHPVQALPRVLPMLLALCGKTSLTTVLLGCPREGLGRCGCPLLGGTWTSCSAICQPGLSLLSLQWAADSSPYGHRLGGRLGVRGPCVRSWDRGTGAASSCNTPCAFRDCPGLISPMALPSVMQ